MKKETIDRYLTGSASEQECSEVEAWYAGLQADIQLRPDEPAKMRILQKIRTSIQLAPERSWRINRLLIWSVSAAAIILICFYVFTLNKATHIMVPALEVANDISPGKNQAVLTLSDGSRVNLSDGMNGKLANSSNIDIEKKDSLLSYAHADQNGGELKFHTLTTPKGGKYQLILPDGTHVWLNAMSSIRYPQAFSPDGRTVYIEGEAYLEVAHRKTPDGKKPIPFIVKSAGQVIQVLGTHFNVNAYKDEAYIQTTLLSGSVKVVAGNKTVFITPGESISFDRESRDLHLSKDVNTSKAVAWKEDFFQFEGDHVVTIMKQLSRWYDVEVAYEGHEPTDQFNGRVSRTVSLSKVLRILSASGIKFKVEGRKITVKNN